jgi:hypothetical protein
MTLKATAGTLAGHSRWGTVAWLMSTVSADEMEARSKGASRSWESQRRMIYRSSQAFVSELADSPPASIAESSSSRCLVSVLRNRTITFSPLILQNVYRSRHIELDSGAKSFESTGFRFFGEGVCRKARKASARTGTSLLRCGSRS